VSKGGWIAQTDGDCRAICSCHRLAYKSDSSAVGHTNSAHAHIQLGRVASGDHSRRALRDIGLTGTYYVRRMRGKGAWTADCADSNPPRFIKNCIFTRNRSVAGANIYAGHSSAWNMFCTLWPCDLDLWPFDLILNGYLGLVVNYTCGKFQVLWLRFQPFWFYRADRQTDTYKQTGVLLPRL